MSMQSGFFFVFFCLFVCLFVCLFACFFVVFFPSQETGTDTFSSNLAKFQQFFPLSILSMTRVAFSLASVRNAFQRSPQV